MTSVKSRVPMTGCLLLALGLASACKSEQSPKKPETLEETAFALCHRKHQCLVERGILKQLRDRDVENCRVTRLATAAGGTEEARAQLLKLHQAQLRECHELPCDQFDDCETRVFERELKALE